MAVAVVVAAGAVVVVEEEARQVTVIGAVGPVGVTETCGPAAPALFVYVPGVWETVTRKCKDCVARSGHGKRPAPGQDLPHDGRIGGRRTRRRAWHVAEARRKLVADRRQRCGLGARVRDRDRVAVLAAGGSRPVVGRLRSREDSRSLLARAPGGRREPKPVEEDRRVEGVVALVEDREVQAMGAGGDGRRRAEHGRRTVVGRACRLDRTHACRARRR